MTYCIAMRLEEGLVFAADTRTNAGVDHIATFKKMHVFQKPGHSCITLLSAGNLATSQKVISKLREACNDTEASCLFNVSSLFHAAELVGDLVREVIAHHSEDQQTSGVDFGCNILLGGQINGEECRLFHIYPQGNFIEATPDTPYFQIGESKYGKPIVDRIISYDTCLNLAMKCALISLDSTIRSNLSVGMPIDMGVYKNDALEIAPERIEEDDHYFTRLRRAWGSGIKMLFDELP